MIDIQISLRDIVEVSVPMQMKFSDWEGPTYHQETPEDHPIKISAVVDCGPIDSKLGREPAVGETISVGWKP